MYDRRKCSECEEWFTTSSPRAVVCSGRCGARRSRRLRGLNADPGGSRLGRTCTECGDEFDGVTYRTRVCSNSCKQRAIRRRKREAAAHALAA